MNENEHRQHVRDALTRIETKLNNEIEIRKDHETRIRKVEHRIWWFTGIGAGTVGLFKFLFNK